MTKSKEVFPASSGNSLPHMSRLTLLTPLPPCSDGSKPDPSCACCIHLFSFQFFLGLSFRRGPLHLNLALGLFTVSTGLSSILQGKGDGIVRGLNELRTKRTLHCAASGCAQGTTKACGHCIGKLHHSGPSYQLCLSICSVEGDKIRYDSELKSEHIHTHTCAYT